MMHAILKKAFTENNNRLSVHDFMALSNEVYYRTRQPLGAQGDFVTAPEISPLFGEIIGLSLIEAWERLGSPSHVDLIELGPGRGFLMEDILRVTKPFTRFRQALCLRFIDINPHFTFSYPHECFEDLTQGLRERPTFFIANEFFDALPIHQHIQRSPLYEQDSSPLIERFVCYHNGELTFSHEENGDIIETCPQAEQLFRKIALHLQRWGGLGLIIDYGYTTQEVKGSTLQAVSEHQFSSPLRAPGQQDLTAHVNFSPFLSFLSSLSPPLAYYFETQRAFLVSRGILTRAHHVLTGADLKCAASYREGLKRLIDPQEMGYLFKALWIERPCE